MIRGVDLLRVPRHDIAVLHSHILPHKFFSVN